MLKTTFHVARAIIAGPLYKGRMRIIYEIRIHTIYGNRRIRRGNPTGRLLLTSSFFSLLFLFSSFPFLLISFLSVPF